MDHANTLRSFSRLCWIAVRSGSAEAVMVVSVPQTAGSSSEGKSSGEAGPLPTRPPRAGLPAWSDRVGGLRVDGDVEQDFEVAKRSAAVDLVGVDLVKELALTPERREQLSTWLSDMQLLRAEYPNVADYLSRTERMPGTGDSQSDLAFDVRLLHYLTGGRSAAENPYWATVAPSVFDHDGRRVVNGGNPQGSARLGYAEMFLQTAYSYAVPSPETIQWVVDFSDGRPILELGAGRGYWAAQLSRAGLAVHAFELEPPDKAQNISFPHEAGQADVWYPVASLDDLSLDACSNHVLLLCWPPGWGNTMASEALDAFESVGGDRLIYIGEPRGGKTADEAFFDGLSARWTLDSSDPRFVSWWNLADSAHGWTRR